MPYPDDMPRTWPGDLPDYLCRYRMPNGQPCDAPVEGQAYERWLESLEPDEDGYVTADPLYCWEHYCFEQGVCSSCGEVLNSDLTCPSMECDRFDGKSQQ